MSISQQRLIFLIAIFFASLGTPLFAETTLYVGQQYNSDEISDRYERVCDLLLNDNLTTKERAKLNYEKFEIMYYHMGLLRTATVCLYYAVYFDPTNKGYINTLRKVYDKNWKNMKIDDSDITAKDFKNIRDSVKNILEKHSPRQQREALGRYAY